MPNEHILSESQSNSLEHTSELKYRRVGIDWIKLDVCRDRLPHKLESIVIVAYILKNWSKNQIVGQPVHNCGTPTEYYTQVYEHSISFLKQNSVHVAAAADRFFCKIKILGYICRWRFAQSKRNCGQKHKNITPPVWHLCGPRLSLHRNQTSTQNGGS